jgi:Rieske 2Fe-2S family protein
VEGVVVADSEHLMRGEEIAATRRPFGYASPLASPPYREPAILAAELERIFFRMWLCVGHQDAVRGPGDWVMRELGGESFVLVRGEGGGLNAFYNVCRHRGTRLLEGSAGSVKDCIRCPYHAWSYALDGSLIAAPLMDDVPGFERADFPLRSLRCDTWQGFVFVNFDPQAAPLAEGLADFPDLSRYGIADMRVGATHEYEIAANWKLVCENYGECYHCPTNHPQLNPVSHFRSGGNSFEGAMFSGGPMRLNDGCTTMTLDGQTRRAPIAGLPDEDRRTVHYFNIYPDFLLSLCPDYVLTHTVWPLDVERSMVRCEWLFPAAAAAAEGFDPSDAVDFWHVTNEQDWALCERAQKGVRSRGYRPALYQGLEQSIYFFDNWYLRTMEDALTGAAGNGAGEVEAAAGAAHAAAARADEPR